MAGTGHTDIGIGAADRGDEQAVRIGALNGDGLLQQAIEESILDEEDAG